MQTALTALAAFLLLDDDDIDVDYASDVSGCNRSFNLPAEPVYEKLTGTDIFEVFAGISEDIFNYILNGIRDSLIGNPQSRYKLTPENRLLAWLYSLRENPNVCHAAMMFGISPGQLCKDFHKISVIFVNTFDDIWIKDMTHTQKMEVLLYFLCLFQCCEFA